MAGIGYSSAICLSVHVKSVPIHIVEFASMIFPHLSLPRPHGCNYVRLFLFLGTTYFFVNISIHLSNIARDNVDSRILIKDIYNLICKSIGSLFNSQLFTLNFSIALNIRFFIFNF